jgi:hypothetical protein
MSLRAGCAFAVCLAAPLLCTENPGGASTDTSILAVKRIYVAQLVGGPQADALRDLIISSIDSTKLFVLTDNPDRADAVLKGAADDHAYVDTLDVDSGVDSRRSGGKSSSGSGLSRASGLYLGVSASDRESHHIRDRKHEAYAAVRLCNKDGDVLWSTSQESQGAKFRSASADVAAKIARQLSLDVEKAERTRLAATGPGTAAATNPVKP